MLTLLVVEVATWKQLENLRYQFDHGGNEIEGGDSGKGKEETDKTKKKKKWLAVLLSWSM